MKVPVQILFFFFSFTISAQAENLQQALISSVEGKVEILTPFAGAKNTEQVMMFEGVKYSYTKAKAGAKVQSKQVVLSSTDGKAKLIYTHGDVVIVGPSTAVVIPTVSDQKNSADQKKELPLMYGKIRSVIDKEGPLSQIKIKTPSAVAGVRGTDLYVSYNPSFDKTEVQVLRGEVEVTQQSNAELFAKPVETSSNALPAKIIPEKNMMPTTEAKVFTVKASEKLTMEVKEAVPAQLGEEAHQAEVKTEIVKSTQQDLVKVKEDSTVVAKLDTTVSAETKKEIEKVETKAFENVVKDVRRYDENAANLMAEKKIASVDEANLMVVKSLAAKAPVQEVKESLPVHYERENKSFIFLGASPDSPGLQVYYNRLLAQKNNTEFRVGIGQRLYKLSWYEKNVTSYNFDQAYAVVPLQLLYRKSARWAFHFDIMLMQQMGNPKIKSDYGFGSTSAGPSNSDYATIALPAIGIEYRFANRWIYNFQYEARARATTRAFSDESEWLHDSISMGIGYLL